jgi:competence protein ComEA
VRIQLTKDESRALAFVALLLALAVTAQVIRRPPVLAPDETPLDLEALAQTADSSIEAAARRSRPFEPGERLDPNSASAEELNRLPGIGPVLADRIVAERERGGPFASVADLERVSGIGPAKRARIEPFLRIEP